MADEHRGLRFPGEDFVDNVIDNLNRRVGESGAVRIYNRLADRAPSIAAREIGTPLGPVVIPEIRVPKISATPLDTRHKEALKAAMAIDASFVVGLVPLVGDAIADVIEDTYGERLRNLLTEPERRLYARFDKRGPSTWALTRALAQGAVTRMPQP